MRSLTAVSLCMVLTSPLFAEVELNGNPQELANYLTAVPQTVTIQGRAEKKLPADRAIIHLKVTTENKSMDAALTENRVLRKEIADTLLAAGLTEDRIQAAKFSSSPESGFFSDKVKSYKVANTLKATVTNEAEFRAVAALIDSRNEITYEQTDFELSNKKEIENLLLAEACQDASTKKTVYENGLQVALTPVRFSNGAVRFAQPAPMLARAKTMTFSSMAESEFADSSAPVQFDEMEFSASITVEYRLEAK
ncbi:MAG: SIMPL domain-containing protein [Kiritimatiellales bacterium]